MAFVELYKTGYLLRIKLSPGASVCGVRGVWCGTDNEEYLKISVNSVAEKGKANKELFKFLSKTLKMPLSSFSLICGATEHMKKIYLDIEQTEENTKKISALQMEK